MTAQGADWWKGRAVKRYAEVQRLKDTLAAVQSALEAHDDCWPDDPCSELAHDIRKALREDTA